MVWGGRLLEDWGAKTFISIDGKQIGTPIIYGFTQYLPFDPLISGRLINVLFSLITYFAIVTIYIKYLKGKNLFPLILLLTFNPYVLLYDRLAIPDSIITALYSLALLVVFRLRGKFQIWDSIILGAIIAIGWYVKSTILLFFMPLVFFYVFSFIKEKELRKQIVLSIVAVFLAFYVIILPHLEHPLYKKMQGRDIKRILSISEVMAFPIKNWLTNAKQIVMLILGYGTPLVFISMIFAIKRSLREFVLPVLFLIIPIFFELFFLNYIDARYLIVVSPLILLIAALYLDTSTLNKKVFSYITIGVVLISGVLIAFFPLKYYQAIQFIPVMKNDFSQYVTGWTSGYGVKEATDWLWNKSRERPMFVFIRDDSGNPEEGTVVYMRKNERVIVLPVGMLDELYKNKDRLILRDPRFYFVSRGTQMGGIESKVKLAVKFPKPLDPEYVGVYEIVR